MIKLLKKKIRRIYFIHIYFNNRRNYYKPFDRHAEIIDVLIQGFNLLSEKLDEVIAETNELEKEVETLKIKLKEVKENA